MMIVIALACLAAGACAQRFLDTPDSRPLHRQRWAYASWCTAGIVIGLALAGILA